MIQIRMKDELPGVEYRDGGLKLNIPKPESSKPKQITEQ
jgi:hypothetical protein